MAPQLLVIGSANTDLVVRTPRFPAPGETLLGGEFHTFPGGKGANQAVAAARLGGAVTFVCKLGHDGFGQQALAGYRREGLDTAHVLHDAEAASGVALIAVNAQGQNTIVVAPGANARLLPADLNALGPQFESAALVVVQLEIPLATVAHAVALARAHGRRVVLNPAPAQALPAAVYEGLFCITPNETEAELLTGVAVHDAASAGVAAQALADRGVQNGVITLGAQGAFLRTAAFTGLVPAPRVRALDTTAAGDVFNGALAVALAEGLGWERAAEFACRAAALSVTRLGAQASAPYRHEVANTASGLISEGPAASITSNS